jgi:hypothetical protein
MPEIIQFENLEESNDKFPDPDWMPSDGPFFRDFIGSLRPENFSREAVSVITNETKSILGKCHDPHDPSFNSNTGIVIGYVQSGKTTSFTALTSLALDNDFNLVIILGGRNNNLLSQNVDEISGAFERFTDEVNIFSVDQEQSKKIDQINKIHIPDMSNQGKFFKEKMTVSVNLKHFDHINKLADMLEKNKLKVGSLNALIIDDEADNASLNNQVGEPEQSATYKALTRLRNSLPRHSLVQYTATPQAVLLTSRKDHYNPDWVRFVSPGEEYIGTKDIFHEEAFNLRRISSHELLEDGIETEPLPESFLKALTIYLLCIAESVHHNSSLRFKKNITLMVHPSRIIKNHQFWYRKISSKIDDWVYESGTNKDQFKKEYSHLFRESYDDLKYTANQNGIELNSFGSLFEAAIEALKVLNIQELNSKNNKVDFRNNRFNIVIGGDLLDRGFVVKGLITTYMPRAHSVNTDTLQQRGRFYGYNRSHFSAIRIFLSKATQRAFTNYAKAEADLYARLKQHLLKNKSLKSWRRVFLLDPALQPCRDNVIGVDLMPRILNGSGWFVTRKPIDASDNEEVITEILRKYESKFSRFNSTQYSSKGWTENSKAIIAENILTSEILSDLLLFQMDESEQEKWASIQTLIASMADRGLTSSIVFMGSTKPSIELIKTQVRTLKNDDLGLSLSSKIHQGKNDNRGYPGGEKIVSEYSDITFQFHRFLVKQRDSDHQFLSWHLSVKLPRRESITEETKSGYDLDYLYNE